MAEVSPRQIDTHKDLPSIVIECGDRPWEINAAAWFNGINAAQSFRRGNQFWAYYLDDEFIGFATLGKAAWSEIGEVAIIPMLAIRREFQGQGYGQQIMAHILKQARQLPNALGVGLYVHQENECAQHVYEKCGFVSYGIWKANHVKMFLAFAASASQ